MMTVGQNKALSVRDRIREMHALKLAPYPKTCVRETSVRVCRPTSAARSVSCCRAPKCTTLHLDLHGLYWHRQSLPTDLLVGAARDASSSRRFVLHIATKDPAVVLDTVVFEVETDNDATAWIDAIQTLVKWHARVPLDVPRKIQVVVDKTIPGASDAWTAVAAYLTLANIACDVTLSYDVVGFGRSLSTTSRYEGCLAVGSALTYHRLVNGLFQQDEARWRAIVPTLPLGVLDVATARAHELVYNVIKRKVLARDVVACHFNQEYLVLATSHVALGHTALDLASPSPMPAMPCLCVRPPAGQSASPDSNVHHQHHVELCSVYNAVDSAYKAWKGSLDGGDGLAHDGDGAETTPLLEGIDVRLPQHEAMAVHFFTPGSIWHRWQEHTQASDGAPMTRLELTLPLAWDVAIDGSPRRLVTGHVQLDCIPNLLHSY
ncbi:Aste57867_12502 [Aphanomyces stellatus]|uniref:Aste57867_12502 protein n=1 Tax=Aphanomyces stellatus TaxID=120398 RepID=A0A485KXQ2_9STRA|nr:hypothetical protein As57867_012456 [Aphanomyces stellatus]VFT89353.1 Aste57867_12502 [Aphanomyces stellatus]